jgi:hypothetical protein
VRYPYFVWHKTKRFFKVSRLEARQDQEEENLINLTSSDYLHECVEMLESRELAYQEHLVSGVKNSPHTSSLSDLITREGMLFSANNKQISFKLNSKSTSTSSASSLPTIFHVSSMA